MHDVKVLCSKTFHSNPNKSNCVPHFLRSMSNCTWIYHTLTCLQRVKPPLIYLFYDYYARRIKYWKIWNWISVEKQLTCDTTHRTAVCLNAIGISSTSHLRIWKYHHVFSFDMYAIYSASVSVHYYFFFSWKRLYAFVAFITAHVCLMGFSLFTVSTVSVAVVCISYALSHQRKY